MATHKILQPQKPLPDASAKHRDMAKRGIERCGCGVNLTRLPEFKAKP